MFGSGAGNGGDANTLYFNDGINGEANGLFAALEVPGQTITKGNGDFTLDIGSNSTVTLGNGDDTITGGHNNKLTIGKGDQSITLSGGNNTITLGRGDSTVSVGGGGNTINLGKGDNTVHGGSGDTINITLWNAEHHRHQRDCVSLPVACNDQRFLHRPDTQDWSDSRKIQSPPTSRPILAALLICSAALEDTPACLRCYLR